MLVKFRKNPILVFWYVFCQKTTKTNFASEFLFDFEGFVGFSNLRISNFENNIIFENPLLTHRFRYKMSSGWYSDLLTCTTSLVEIWVRYPQQLVIF